MSMSADPRHATQTADPSNTNAEPLSISDLFKFTALASLSAIFADAAIAHAMLWGNDPYWSYWVTDTLLMATVFGLGTAWLGIGPGRGAIITAVHVTILTAYYWSLSPIALPSQPEWLDLERTWLTGLPVHFGVYYLGYLVALSLWKRRSAAATRGSARMAAPLARTAGIAGVTAAGVVIVAGFLQTLLTSEFPGATWFIVRIAVAFPFTLAWWAMAGDGRSSAVCGGILLGFLLITYGHYLAPVGLPNPSLRLLAENPPPAAVHWLSYRQEFLVLLPVTQLVALAGYLIASRWTAFPGRYRSLWRRGDRGWVIAALVVLIAAGAATSVYTDPEANRATIVSTGSGNLEQGARYGGELVATAATLSMTVEDRNTHRTSLPPRDRVNIKASIPSTDPAGTTYVVEATTPMVTDPQGRFTTWSGVGFNVWHHGRSGIGTAKLPPMKSEVAVFALGNISVDGRIIAAGVPVHAMTSSREGARLELDIGDPDFSLPGIPGGHLRAVWAEYDGGHARYRDYARYGLGSAVLVILLAFAIVIVRRQTRSSSQV
jgi:hypothetical protein